jgi:hypothetical protein
MHRLKVEVKDHVLTKKEALQRELVNIKEKVAAKKEVIKVKVADGVWYVIEQAVDPTLPSFATAHQQQPSHQQHPAHEEQPGHEQQLYSAI